MGENARERLAARPALTNYEGGFYADFFDLSTERQTGMSVGPIPSSAIYAYCQRNQLSQLQADILYRVIRTMDSAYLDAVRSKQAKAQASTK